MPEKRLKTLSAWKSLAQEVEVLYAYPKDYKRTLIDRILHKIKIPRDANTLNKSIREACISFEPDIVFIVKGVTVKPSTLKFIKARGIKSISWSNDDMYSWHNRSLWYTLGLKQYDLVVTQKSYNCNSNELPSLGAKVLFQDKAIDPDINYPVNNCKLFDCVHDVVFIGTKEQNRLEYLKYIASSGIEVHVYGWGFKEPRKYHDNLIFHNTHLYADHYNAAFGCSKIALNFLRKMNRDLQTSRSIEIPASRGFMLAERTDEHQRLFEEGQEADYFSTKEELLKKIIYYLKNDKKSKTIASAGYKRVHESDYTFKNRITEILDTIELD